MEHYLKHGQGLKISRFMFLFSPKMISKSKIRFGVLIKLFHKLTISQEFNYSERTTGSKQTRPAHRNFDMGFERNLSFKTPSAVFFFSPFLKSRLFTIV